ncbi:MAG: aminotransferase class I/II-fold pyridoxal phosphate-dependent enzyme, partial [Firmicutes bacterium]|nr:aminotransferase class I/II-fold pyridoxal phosphate-dependent enzyme [Bacillota bacterium]
LKDSPRPWAQEETVKFLCPCPGYDRHFNVTKSFGAELIPVPMLSDGPDMDAVEELVKDPAVKGIWCVPKYSNPTGIIFSEEVCRRLASMETAAPDFTIMWDNAYCIHEFDGDFVPFVEMLSLCASCGHANRVYEFASFSKVTYAGASVSCMASSVENLAHFKSLMTFRMICGNKVAQLMHVRFLKNKENTLALMKKHGALLKPKFDGILETLKGLEEYGIASWSEPKGGYFISLNGYPHTAKRTFELCKAAGLTMTGAGATFPYGKDPEDRNLRIAPSFAPPETVAQAAGVLCVSLRLAALEQIAKERFGEVLN